MSRVEYFVFTLLMSREWIFYFALLWFTHFYSDYSVTFYFRLNFKNCVISMVLPPRLHLSGVTKSVPDEKALSADTLDA